LKQFGPGAVSHAFRKIAGWLTPAAPTVLAGCSSMGGVVLLFSKAMPESGMRLRLGFCRSAAAGH